MEITSGLIGVIVLSGLTIFIYRLVSHRGGIDYGIEIPRLEHFIGASRTVGEAKKRAEEVIEHRTEVE